MKYKKIVLENGLTVIYEQRDVPVTTVFLATRFGSKYETESEKGIAHFIEHMCFKGTKKRTVNEISSQVESVGGVLNAFTHEEITAYHVKLPSEHLEIGMDVIFDIFFNPSFPEDELKKETSVICEEIKMYKDNPRYFVMNKIKSCLYENPFGDFIAGSEKILLSIGRKDVLEKHNRFYCPENSVLCVVGNNSLEDVIAFAKKFSPDKKFEAEKSFLPKNKIENYLEERENLEQANVAIGFHFPFGSSKERYAVELFNSILGVGMSSRLFSEVREKRGLVYTVRSGVDMGSDYGYLTIYFGTSVDKVDEAIGVCLKEFEKMSELSLADLERAKVQVIGNQKVSMEGSEETAVNLTLEEFLDTFENYYSFEEKIKKVSLEEARALAKNKEHACVILRPKVAG